MFTRENMLAQYAKNAKQLREMATKARAIAPKKFRGFTADKLEADADRYEKLAAGDPAAWANIGKPLSECR